MKNVKSKFNAEQLEMIRRFGIELSDDRDYSQKELQDIHDEIEADEKERVRINLNKNDDPTPDLLVWESIIDLFQDKFGIV